MKISQLIRLLQTDLAIHGDLLVITDTMNPNLHRIVVPGSDNKTYCYLTNNVRHKLIIILKQEVQNNEVPPELKILNKEKAPE